MLVVLDNAQKVVIPKQPKALKVPSRVLKALAPKLPHKENRKKVERRFSVSAKAQGLHDFFLAVAKGSKTSILVSPEINKREITLSLNNVTISEVFEAMSSLYGFEFRKTSYVYDVLPGRIQTQIYKIDYLDVERSGSSSTSIDKISENGGGSGDVSTEVESEFWSNLESSLELIIKRKSVDDEIRINKPFSTVVDPSQQQGSW